MIENQKRREGLRKGLLVNTEAVSVEYKMDRLQEIKQLEIDEVGCVYKLFFQLRSPLRR